MLRSRVPDDCLSRTRGESGSHDQKKRGQRNSLPSLFEVGTTNQLRFGDLGKVLALHVSPGNLVSAVGPGNVGSSSGVTGVSRVQGGVVIVVTGIAGLNAAIV